MDDKHIYYMSIAVSTSEKGNCLGRKVGAILVKHNRIIGAGYNGTPEGMNNCTDSGCARCYKYRQSGELYDKCICVHAEENLIVTAARFGHGIENSIVYTTLQPCFTCLKKLLQANVKTVYYMNKLFTSDSIVDNKENTNEKINEQDKKLAEYKQEQEQDLRQQYQILENRFKKIPIQIEKKRVYEHLVNMIANICSKD